MINLMQEPYHIFSRFFWVCRLEIALTENGNIEDILYEYDIINMRWYALICLTIFFFLSLSPSIIIARFWRCIHASQQITTTQVEYGTFDIKAYGVASVSFDVCIW